MAGSTTIWRRAPFALLLSAIGCTTLLPAIGCTTIEPGPDFVVPQEVFDSNYYFCHVEPEFIVANKCGPGAASDGNSCHFSSSVSGMALLDHGRIDCGGGDLPIDPASTAGAAQSDFQAVSLEMSHDYTTAPLFVRPSNGANHPRVVFSPSDATAIRLLSTWAAK